MKKYCYLIGLLLTLVWSVFNCVEALVIFYDDDRSGELAMAMGISKAFKDQTGMSPDLYGSSNVVKFKTHLKGEKDTLLLIGQKGFDVIEEQAADLRSRHWKIAHVAHQIFERHAKIESMVDRLFLPEYLENTAFQKEKLPNTEKVIWTNGVATSLSPESVAAVYEEAKASFPDTSVAYYIVYLGGDAENTDGTTSLYSDEEARSLAGYAVKDSGDVPLIVLNGPRTGRHSPDLKVVEGSHRDEAPLDHVTRAFIEALEAVGKDHKLYDFRFGQTSMYRPVLGMLLQGKAKILIPGESNSVISDIVALGLQEKAVAFMHNAMNDLHHANVRFANKHHGISYLDHKFKLYPGKMEGPQEDPAVQIALSLSEPDGSVIGGASSSGPS